MKDDEGRRGRHTFEDTDSGGEVVDTTSSTEGGNNHGWRGDEIVSEGIVQVTLWQLMDPELAIDHE